MKSELIKYLFSIFFVLNSIIFPYKGASQKKFNLTLSFPLSLVQNGKIEIRYNNGLTVKKWDKTINHAEVHMIDSFYSKYATISIFLDSNNLCGLPSYNCFYISDLPSRIDFNGNTSDHAQNAVQSIKIINAYNTDTIAKRFNSYVSEDMNRLKRFSDSISKLSVADSLTFLRNKEIVRNLINRELQFIREHKDNYFCFEIFKILIAPNAFGNPYKLLNFYKKVFPDELKQTIEGKRVVEALRGSAIASGANIQAPDFKTIDIHGQTVSLQKEYGKFVLLNFWASWCPPCMAELPAIKAIRVKYPRTILKIISISFDHDSSAFIHTIKKYKINWDQVYRDKDLAKKYGGISALPQLFLINKRGRIIYNRNSGKETDEKNLKRLNFILRESIPVN